MIYEPFDIIEVPFPFSDLPRAKRRKALVISTQEFNKRNGNTILMMITSAEHSKWFNDVSISNWMKSGLKKPCIARMKLFTLDNRLIILKTGHLTTEDQNRIRHALISSLGFRI